MTQIKRLITNPGLILEFFLITAALFIFGIVLYHAIIFLTGVINYFFDNPVTLLFVIIALPFIIRRQHRKFH